jgi:hypothetical protein
VAQERGTRALDHLRAGVEQAINALGSGFLAHPANAKLKEKLRSGELPGQDYYRQLLRLVYRLLFLFVAEDRDLLYDPEATPEARERYIRYYSTTRLRHLAAGHRGTKHMDIYRGLRIVMEKLGSDEGCSPLALPALGSFLWSEIAIPDLAHCDISNRNFLEAVRALAFTLDNKIWRSVDYKNLGSEELGSIYESLLELHPEFNIDAATFNLTTAGGHERKTTGSYYTPTSLIQCLLDSALDPVLAEAAHKPNAEEAILSLKVCDPACGSGHFLIAAAHRIARRLAAIRTGDEEPSPEATRTALRDVISHCLYGVDVNPMAVELCKVNLWMEAIEPGKPLTFLEHHIQCGNSLLGTTLALLAQDIPDTAFLPIEGDEKAVASAFRKRNKVEREGQMTFAAIAESAVPYGNLADEIANLDTIDDSSLTGVHEKEERYSRLAESSEYRKARLIADAWCAAFVWRKTRDTPEPATHDVFCRLLVEPEKVPAATRVEIARLSAQYRFFHWHLAFPDVFRIPTDEKAPQNALAGWNGGFDVVIGNPPWERIKIQEKEWFATRRPDIAAAPNAAARRRLISALATEDPGLRAAFLEAGRQAEGESHLVRNSGRYPLCGRGDINTYAIFAETNRMLIYPSGRAGFIIQSDIATGDTYKEFFASLLTAQQLVSLYDFVNTEGIFPGIHRTHPHFCLITISGRAVEQPADFAFWNTNVGHLSEIERHFTLTAEELALLNPTTRTCPVFRFKRDAELTKVIYRNVPALITQRGEDDWNAIFFKKMIDFGIHAELITFAEESPGPNWLGVYEAKMIHHFHHRAATYFGVSEHDRQAGNARSPELSELQDPRFRVKGRCWVERTTFIDRMDGKPWSYPWFVSMRDVTNTTNERTAIFAIRPEAPSVDKLPSLFPKGSPREIAWLVGSLSSFVFDYVARQKVGGTNLGGYIVEQLSVLPRCSLKSKKLNLLGLSEDWFVNRILELTYTAWDLESFAKDCGYSGPPFCWNAERRFLLRCELDATYFHLYGIARNDVDYIMETFPIVKRNDIKQHGDFHTKHMILDIYDRMQHAMGTGKPYQTLLDPPPADPRVAHPPRTEN